MGLPPLKVVSTTTRPPPGESIPIEDPGVTRFEIDGETYELWRAKSSCFLKEIRALKPMISFPCAYTARFIVPESTTPSEEKSIWIEGFGEHWKITKRDTLWLDNFQCLLKLGYNYKTAPSSLIEANALAYYCPSLRSEIYFSLAMNSAADPEQRLYAVERLIRDGEEIVATHILDEIALSLIPFDFPDDPGLRDMRSLIDAYQAAGRADKVIDFQFFRLKKGFIDETIEPLIEHANLHEADRQPLLEMLHDRLQEDFKMTLVIPHSIDKALEASVRWDSPTAEALHTIVADFLLKRIEETKSGHDIHGISLSTTVDAFQKYAPLFSRFPKIRADISKRLTAVAETLPPERHEHIYLAEALKESGNVADSIRIYWQMIRNIHPETPLADHNWKAATSLIAILGESKEVFASIETQLQKFPLDTGDLLWISHYFATQLDFQRADKYLQRAKKDPDFGRKKEIFDWSMRR